MQTKPAKPASGDPAAYHTPRKTATYTDDELAEIYNQARIDYIVPMPMNGKRMREYVDAYDIDLDASLVALDRKDSEPNGICMLGVRGKRSWITRLGVIPERRRRHVGQYLMNALIDWSREQAFDLVQLEVIKGNEPAYRLFTKLGFEVTRDLLVIRRAPGRLTDEQHPAAHVAIKNIDDEVETYLAQRESGASWVEETQSLLNIGKLKGVALTLESGETGWIIYHNTPFQLNHFVLKPDCSLTMYKALIGQVHLTHPMKDTKVENVPADHPTWDAFKAMGYVEAFQRIEMFLKL